MTSRFLTAALFVLMLAMQIAGANSTSAQTLGWGRHVSSYGYGNGAAYAPVAAPPATAYYRAPAIGYAQPTTAYYAPQAAYVPQATYYAPNTTYYRGGYGYPSPIAQEVNAGATIAPAGYNAPISNYPPRTVFPTTTYAAQPTYALRPTYSYPGGGNYVGYAPVGYAAPTVANYAPNDFYRTGYARTPVTAYRPMLVMDPVTGGTTTVLQPCQTYEYQARKPGWFSWMHPHRPTTTAYAPAACYGNNCNYGQGYVGCGPIAPSVQPYYVPSNTTVPTTVWPSNAAPSSTIAPPTTFTPNTYSPNSSGGFTPAPSSGTFVAPPSTNVPANIAPSLNPTELNAGPRRSEYAPNTDTYYTPNRSTVTPYVAPAVPYSPPAVNESFRPIESSDEPLLLPSSPTTSSTQPRAEIRRQTNITPIPDPEVSGTGAKLRSAPRLLSPQDRVASNETTDGLHRLASHEQEVVTKKPTLTRIAPARPAVLGDDVWRSVGESQK